MNKCNHCPLLTEDRECPGQKNRRVCVRADPESELYTPGILEKIRSFAVATARHVAAGSPMATEEQKAARLGICATCEHLDHERRGCRLCGCSMDMKTGWADSACPIGKWTAVEPAPVEPEPAKVEEAGPPPPPRRPLFPNRVRTPSRPASERPKPKRR